MPAPRVKTVDDAVYVALLRGINVGGKNKLPMKGLTALFEGLGCGAVRTYIQSGNVVFRATPSVYAGLAARLTAAIRAGFGIEVPLVLRAAAALDEAIAANPFVAEGHDPETLHVMFLREAPEGLRAAKLDANRSPGDAYALRGAEVYLRCPNGLARTKLTNDYFDRTLATVSTVRNWRTTLTLQAMTREG
jgi:uncharacterized protein (DUF1697 family)